MKELIKKLEQLIERSPQSCFFNDPATEEQIIALETRYGFTLPASFRIFLKNFNGGFITQYEDIDGIDMDDLAWNSNYILAVELINELYDGINFKTQGMDVHYIPFLHTGDGEYLGFKIPMEGDESKVYDLWHEAPAEDWAASVVYNSFSELLKDYINNNGDINTM